MKTKPKIVNFVSEVRNIGNLIAVLGIERMLESRFAPALRIDCRRFAQVEIDAYDVALVGGAGLFHSCFTEFWTWLARQRIPVMIWGVGVCLPVDHPSVSDMRRFGAPPEQIDLIQDRLIFCNVRDDLTQQRYRLGGSVTACPSVVYVQDRLASGRRPTTVLYSHHPELLTDSERTEIVKRCTDSTDNLFDNCDPVEILDKFASARLVVTSRLHGAILAASLGRPYVAICRDQKISAFVARYGGGLILEDFACLDEAISAASNVAASPLDSSAIRRVGNEANLLLGRLFC